MGLYELLGVDPHASDAAIRSAYRRLSRQYHPDNQETGNAEKFREIQEGYEVLIDPERRRRYDATGRTDENKVTDRAVRDFVQSTMTACVEAVDQFGGTDNPVLEDIHQKILRTFRTQRGELKQKTIDAERRLRRARQLKERFKKKGGGDDLVGEALDLNIKRIRGELDQLADMTELNLKAEEVFKSYSYEVGPRPEGQDGQGPTSRRSGIRFIST